MKKLMSVMLGLSLLVGTVNVFAADNDTKTSKGKKKSGKKKKGTAEDKKG